jgi:hypothetical protein
LELALPEDSYNPEFRALGTPDTSRVSLCHFSESSSWVFKAEHGVGVGGGERHEIAGLLSTCSVHILGVMGYGAIFLICNTGNFADLALHCPGRGDCVRSCWFSHNEWHLFKKKTH